MQCTYQIYINIHRRFGGSGCVGIVLRYSWPLQLVALAVHCLSNRSNFHVRSNFTSFISSEYWYRRKNLHWSNFAGIFCLRGEKKLCKHNFRYMFMSGTLNTFEFISADTTYNHICDFGLITKIQGMNAPILCIYQAFEFRRGGTGYTYLWWFLFDY